MLNRLGHPDRLEVDNLISNLMQERLLSENEVKFICDKVLKIFKNYFLFISKSNIWNLIKRQKNYF